MWDASPPFLLVAMFLIFMPIMSRLAVPASVYISYIKIHSSEIRLEKLTYTVNNMILFTGYIIFPIIRNKGDCGQEDVVILI